ncbi:ferritin, lower subunit-like [Arvicanthis niloticus]|uniref:ferritin, lower subunit-like n=1 Tax=Arvicanthis niloticus TaxID=61156 RepID=UPI001486DE34|nr:ferritin heavy chain-like [Arvicanthis niloticus]
MFSYEAFSEECTEALNQVVAYHLHTSHVYLAMAHSFIVDTGKENPPFVSYFESLADDRRETADKFLKRLWTRNNRISPPTYEKINKSVPPQQADMKEITTPVKAILLAQEMEKTLTSILLHLKAAAGHESDLLKFLKSVLRKQRKNEENIKTQLSYEQRIEMEEEKKAQTEKPSTSGVVRPLKLKKQHTGCYKVSDFSTSSTSSSC